MTVTAKSKANLKAGRPWKQWRWLCQSPAGDWLELEAHSVRQARIKLKAALNIPSHIPCARILKTIPILGSVVGPYSRIKFR